MRCARRQANCPSRCRYRSSACASARPRVHCITNAVAQTFTANVLLAAGAVPSMTIAPDEVAAFAGRADALLVNLGTFDAERQKASLVAVAAANKARKPWVLDPVFIDRSRAARRVRQAARRKRRAALRLNQAEFAALGGKAGDAAPRSRARPALHT